MEFQKNGAAYISGKIRDAMEDGTRQITVTGSWEIEETILLPSDFTVILNDCHLRMGDGTFCNMFVNENCRTEAGRTREGTDRNIRIIGIGKAILDGGSYNGLSERNCCKEGRPHISVNCLMLLANVDGIDIQGLQIWNQRWWALTFLFCSNGKVRDIDFRGNDLLVTPSFEGYSCILVKNGDGIDLRAGCHDFIIENITGFTEDDSIACTCLPGDLERMYGVAGLSTELYNVIIRNVMTSSYCGNVRLLNQGGTALYNILIDGVMDTSLRDPSIKAEGHRCEGTVRIGDRHLYAERLETDITRNITVRNVYSRARRAVTVDGEVERLVLDNINGFDGGGS